MNPAAGGFVLGCLAPFLGGEATVRLDVPEVYVTGRPFEVELHLECPPEGARVPAWALGAAGFTLDGEPLGERPEGEAVALPGGARLALKFDLAPAVAARAGRAAGDLLLGFEGGVAGFEPVSVPVLEGAPEGLDFTALAPEELAKYDAVLVTNRGLMHAEFWPDVAPDHVRNFLDLAYTGFYDGVLFHRVGPGFMIQGGDPTGTGRGKGPRTVGAELSDRKHVRGVLSMARGTDLDSASCQFFVMQASVPALDGKYSAFGKLRSGYETLDRIATAKGQQIDASTVRPNEPQRILYAAVVKAAGGGAPDDDSGNDDESDHEDK